MLSSALKTKVNIFYLLAFAPLLLIAYSFHTSGLSILGALIPLYGFFLLFIKKDTLLPFLGAVKIQRYMGIVVVLAGFFMFYFVATVFPSFALYGAWTIFYSFFIVGLLLAFFSVQALKESLSAVFLIVAGGSSYYLGQWLELFMEPLVPYFVQIMMLVLSVLGIPANVHNPNPNVIWLDMPAGPVPLLFEAGCIGIYSFLAFSVIIVATMMEEMASTRTKLMWSIGGVIGTFIVNIIRVSFIAVVLYYFGYENWGEIHSWIGYSLFLLWLVFFLALFSRREAIRNKIGVFLTRV